MKKIFFLLAIIAVFSSCEENANEFITDPGINKTTPLSLQAGSTTPFALNAAGEYTDGSGLVKIKLFPGTVGPNQVNIGAVTVDADYVIVGGAAWVSSIESGAYLTESRPDLASNTWRAASKDHQYSDSHVLNITAVGLKIEGVTPDQLKSYMQIFTNESGYSSHPNTSVAVPSNYILLGGGAKVNWSGNGNLLTESYPIGNSWMVASKDHKFASPASITAFAIGIQNVNLPGFGYLEAAVSAASTYSSSGQGVISNSVPSGWIISCPGGQAQYSGAGRLIMGIEMSNYNPFNSTIRTKDIGTASSGYSYAYAARIRKKP